jgi:Family of unknown function (DUF6165)
MKILAEISVGELIDKITILDLKLDHVDDPEKRTHVARERAALTSTMQRDIPPAAELSRLADQLKSVNAALWRVEDELRLCEREGRFDSEFVALARSVYHTNDRRARLKHEINQLTNSEIVEQKSYAAY